MKILFSTIIDMLSLWWAAFVLTILWGWFIVPFFDMNKLPVAYAMGLCVISMLMFSKIPKIDENTDTFDLYFNMIFSNAFKPLFALFIGWITTWFI